MVKSGTKADELKAANPAEAGVPARAPSTLHSVDGGDGAGDDEVIAKGTSIGRYLVLGRLGAGAMGVVYAAYDPELDRKIAIKILRPQDGTGDKARFQERLVREAKAIAKLSHPNVVGVFDVGVHEGQVFLAMEYLGGGTLRDWVGAKKRHWREIVKMFIEVGQGLAAAHAEGLIHRDFKPDNVLLDKQGKPKVVDFGLVRLLATGSDASAEAEPEPTAETPREGPVPLTRTGAFAGTPAYMAPEQFLGKMIDARTDQFAFCAALYEALYGERPFAGETVMALGGAVTKGRIRPLPKNVDVPGWVRACVVRGLQVTPGERHPGFEQLLALLRSDPIARFKRRLGVGVAIAMVAITIFVLQRRSSYRRAEIEHQVRERIADAERSVSKSRAAKDAALTFRERAFRMFDQRRREDGERVWRDARSAMKEADGALERAEQALVAALTIDSARDSVGTELGQVLFERALLAELEQRKEDLARHLVKLASTDRTGEFARRWNRPGSLTLRTEPAGAAVVIERYFERPDGYRELRRVPEAACRAESSCDVQPGSYRLKIVSRGRPEVLMPFVIKRGDAVTLLVRVPAKIPDGFAFIPRGTFIFGDYDEAMRTSFLKTVPAHEVETRGYVIGKTEVTYADWIAFLDRLTPSRQRSLLPEATEKKMASLQGSVQLLPLSEGQWRLDISPIDIQYSATSGRVVAYKGRNENSKLNWLNFPVSGVSGDQAQAYLAWLRTTGMVPGARLCTEFEWERAARGADDRVFPHGDVLGVADANHDVTYGRIATAFGPDTVGLHPLSRSPFEVDDLVGNVWELVVSSLDPRGHAIRGGGYYFFQMNGRVTNREPFESAARSVHIGMRVCADWEV